MSPDTQIRAEAGASVQASTGIGVVTIVAGRRPHLRRLLEGMARQDHLADELIIVRMDGPDCDLGVPDALLAASARSARVLECPADDGPLPLAAARNAGAAAITSPALVLLDVDCIPGRGFVRACARVRSPGALIVPVVRYLNPGVPAADSRGVSDNPAGTWREDELHAASHRHPARPAPRHGELVRDDRHELAWTTALLLERETFSGIGGFDERFTGYGAEDTDFAIRAASAGIGVWWSGDAVAYHQHHDTSGPPRQHLADIVRNARTFRRLHGWWPMAGWLTAFAAEGLVEFDPVGDHLEQTAQTPLPEPAA